MSETNKLIKTMDFFVQLCQESGGYKDCLHCCQDNSKNCDYSENADLIKLRLQSQLDERLVEKVVNIGMLYGIGFIDQPPSESTRKQYEEAKAEIRKLLKEPK